MHLPIHHVDICPRLFFIALAQIGSNILAQSPSINVVPYVSNRNVDVKIIPSLYNAHFMLIAPKRGEADSSIFGFVLWVLSKDFDMR